MKQTLRSFHSLPALLPLALLASAACLADAANTNGSRSPLENVVEGYFDRILELNPTFASYIGDYRFNDQFENNLGREWLEAALALEKRLDLVLAGRVEAAVTGGDMLPQQAVGSDDLRPEPQQRPPGIGMVQHQEVIAKGVELVGVAPGLPSPQVGDGRHLLVEDAIAQRLRSADLGSRAGEPDLEPAEPAERRRRSALPPRRAPDPVDGTGALIRMADDGRREAPNELPRRQELTSPHRSAPVPPALHSRRPGCPHCSVTPRRPAGESPFVRRSPH